MRIFEINKLLLLLMCIYSRYYVYRVDRNETMHFIAMTIIILIRPDECDCHRC